MATWTAEVLELQSGSSCPETKVIRGNPRTNHPTSMFQLSGIHSIPSIFSGSDPSIIVWKDFNRPGPRSRNYGLGHRAQGLGFKVRL